MDEEGGAGESEERSVRPAASLLGVPPGNYDSIGSGPLSPPTLAAATLSSAAPDANNAAPSTPSRRSALVRRTEGNRTHIPDAAVACMAAERAGIPENEALQLWLSTLRLSRYYAAFRDNGVNVKLLSTLSNDDLRDSLGVRNLRHRRILLDAAQAMEERRNAAARRLLPEDARFLSDQSNISMLVQWMGLSIQLQTFAFALLLLYPGFERHSLKLAAGACSFIGIVTLVYGAVQEHKVFYNYASSDFDFNSTGDFESGVGILWSVASVLTVAAAAYSHPVHAPIDVPPFVDVVGFLGVTFMA